MSKTNAVSTDSFMRRSIYIGYMSQGLSILIGLISVPLMLHYFDSERYGVWTLIVGIGGYLSLSNFGIPTAALVLISKLNNNFEKYLILIKSFKLLLIISIFFLILFTILMSVFPGWVELIGNISLENVDETKSAIIIMGAGVLIRSSFSIALSAFSGFQRVDIVKFSEIITMLTNFLALFWTIYIEENLVYLAWVTASSSVIISIIFFMYFFYKYNFISTKCEINSNNVSFNLIILSSFRFFQIGTAATLVWSADNLIISNMMNIDYVAPYSIAFRLFSIGFIAFTLINGLLIPFYGNEISNNRWDKINKIYNLQLTISPIISGFVWIAGILLSKEMIQLWMGRNDMFGGYLLIFSLGGYGYFLSFININSGIMTAMNLSKQLVRVAWLEGFVNITLSIFLIGIFGIGGVALATMIAGIVCPFLLLPKHLSLSSAGKLKFDFKDKLKLFIVNILPFVILSLITSLYVDDLLTKIIISMFIIIIYFIISWLKITDEQKYFLLHSIIQKKSIK
jgi:O-antigen/teichoic acid export membrane protein